MANLKNIFQFGWPYLKRYRARLFAGIVLGMLFGVSNASFVWATKTLFDRMAPSDQQVQSSAGVDKTAFNSSCLISRKR